MAQSKCWSILLKQRQVGRQVKDRSDRMHPTNDYAFESSLPSTT